MLEHNIDRKILPQLKAIQTEADAVAITEALVETFMVEGGYSREDAERIVRDNIGYLGGYCSHEDRARIERLFKVEHPFFGSIEKNGPPTPEAAFAIGFAFGQRIAQKDPTDN